MTKKSVLILSIIFIFTLALAGCSSGTGTGSTENKTQAQATSPAATATPDSSPKPASAKLKVAYHPNLHGAGPMIIAQEKGYFKEENLDVELVKVTAGPPELQAMAAGDLDIGYLGPGAHFLVYQGQAKVIALDSLNFGDMILTRKDTGIKSVKDLKGKTIGLSKGTSPEFILDLALAKNGMKKEDVNVVNIDLTGLIPAFVTKKIDAVGIFVPYTAEINKHLGKDNVVKLAGEEDFLPEHTFPQSWVANNDFVKNKKDVAIRFLRAYLKAVDYRKNNFPEAVKLTSKFTNVPEEDLNEMIATTKWFGSQDIKKMFEDGTAKKYYESQVVDFVDSKKLEKPVDASSFLDTELLLEAMKTAK